MALSSAGIGSNIDVNGIVSQLMTVESQPLVKLNQKEANYQAKLSAYGTIQGALSSFQNAVHSLNDFTKFQSVKASAADTSILTASAASNAVAGSYSIEVSKLAQTQKLASTGQASTTTAIGGGSSTTLTFDFGTIAGTLNTTTGKYDPGASFISGGTTKSVVIDSSNNSLEGIRDAINNAGIGATASIINDGSGTPYRLVLSSNTMGVANSIKISVSDGAGGAGDANLTSLLAHDPQGTQNLSETASAQNAELKVNGIFVSKATNSVSDVINGVTLNLAKTNAGSPTVLTVAHDTGNITAMVSNFVKSYNDMNKTISQMTAYNAGTKTAAVLQGDNAILSVQNSIRRTIGQPVDNSSGSLRTLSQIGISFQRDGSLALDTSKLQSAIDNNPNDVAALFASNGSTSDSMIKFAGSSTSTMAGTYAINITTVPSTGVDVAGTINGVAATGSGQILTGAGSAEGLQLLVSGGSTGDRGIVRFSQGTASKLDQLIQSFLSSDGVMSSRTSGINSSIKDIGTQRDRINLRLVDIEKRYRAQFTALDVMIGQISQTSNFLTQQLAKL